MRSEVVRLPTESVDRRRGFTSLGRGLAVSLATVALASQLLAATPLVFTDIGFARSMLQYRSEGVTVATQIASGKTIISMPVAYYKTGVLKRDIRLLDKNGNVGAVFIRAGAHGFLAGDFDRTKLSEKKDQIWCFSEAPQNPASIIKCVSDRADTANEVTNWVANYRYTNKYLPVFFSQDFGSRTQRPEIEDKVVTVHPNLRVDCTLLGWDSNSANIRCLLAGRPIAPKYGKNRARREADGSALFMTPSAGLLRLSQIPGSSQTQITRSAR